MRLVDAVHGSPTTWTISRSCVQIGLFAADKSRKRRQGNLGFSGFFPKFQKKYLTKIDKTGDGMLFRIQQQQQQKRILQMYLLAAE